MERAGDGAALSGFGVSELLLLPLPRWSLHPLVGALGRLRLDRAAATGVLLAGLTPQSAALSARAPGRWLPGIRPFGGGGPGLPLSPRLHANAAAADQVGRLRCGHRADRISCAHL